MATQLASPPLQTPLSEKIAGEQFVSKGWAWWFRALTDRAQVAAYAIKTIALTAQIASVGLTSLVPTAAAGLYRVSYRFRLSTADAVSSSVQVTIASTEGGVACLQSSAAYTGNAVNRPQSGTIIVKADALTPIQFAVTYATGGGVPQVVFDVDVSVEQL